MLFFAWWVNGALFGASILAICVAQMRDEPKPWHLLVWPSVNLAITVGLSW
jgi:hypothetical protein